MVQIINSALYKQLTGKNQVVSFNEESIEYSIDRAIPEWLSVDWLMEAAKSHYEPYVELMRKFYVIDFSKLSFEKPPYGDGWFFRHNGQWVRAKRPKGDVGYIDFETNQQQPFCGVLVSLQTQTNEVRVYYYIATEPGTQHVSVGDFKLLIGHNIVAFDRQFILEAYEYNNQMRFIDTKALHKLQYGLGEASMEPVWRLEVQKPHPAAWAQKSSPSDLGNACKLLLDVELDKSLQNAHKKKWQELQNKILSYLQYCFLDVVHGIRLYQALMKTWKEYCPHPFNLYGLIERSCLRLKLDDQYKEQLAKINTLVSGKEQEFSEKLKLAALNSKCPNLADFIRFKARYALNFKDANTAEFVQELTYIKDQLAHYGQLGAFKKTPNKQQLKQLNSFVKLLTTDDKLTAAELNSVNKYLEELTLSKEISTLILQVHWHGKPLQRVILPDGKKAWGIRDDNGEWQTLPGAKTDRTGNPLGKTHFHQYVVGELEIRNTSFNYTEVFDYLALTSMWASYHKRLGDLVTRQNIWLPDSCPAGTVTGRVTGATCAVIPNPDSKKAGSEFKLMLQPSDGHLMVKSDMDRQEVIIASALVDSNHKFCGSTEFCVEALLGDYHQIVADRLGLPDQRKLIKNLNFACMFGASVNLICSMIIQTAKGKYTTEQAMNLAREHQKALKGIKINGVWCYGVASELFNTLNDRARSIDQRTAIFGRKIPNSLNQRYGTIHYNTACNFPVQSCGQELIDIVLIGVRCLAEKLDYQSNPMILIHDEVCFDTPKADAEKVREAMQYSHLLSKIMLYQNLGIKDFPTSQMWFSSVDIDICLRKDATRVITPTFDSDEHFTD